MSLIGGGQSILPGRTSPAWGFQWIIPASEYEVNREYTFNMRLVYKHFLCRQDVIHEVSLAQKSFEKLK